MTLGDKQRLFSKCLSTFLVWLYAKNYEVTFGEVKRSDEQAAINALGDSGRKALAAVLRMPQHGTLFAYLADAVDNNVGSGIKKTLHEDSLAVDLNLFVGGVYRSLTEDYKEAGLFWESLNPLCVWGGRFGDGNHFSITHEGRK